MLDIFRRYFIVLLLAIIILIVWGGILLLSDKRHSTINANAETYTKHLQATFDKEILDTVAKRTTDSFPILPSSFFELDSD